MYEEPKMEGVIEKDIRTEILFLGFQNLLSKKKYRRTKQYFLNAVLTYLPISPYKWRFII